jgi:hypothetical protein
MSETGRLPSGPEEIALRTDQKTVKLHWQGMGGRIGARVGDSSGEVPGSGGVGRDSAGATGRRASTDG